MIQRILGALALSCVAWHGPTRVLAVHPATPPLPSRYDVERSAEPRDTASALEVDDFAWAEATPTDFGDVLPPGPIRLAQASAPAPDGSGQAPAAASQGADSGTTSPNPNEYDLAGDTELQGLQSILNANSPSPEEFDASMLRAQHDAATLLRGVPGVEVNAHAPNIHESALRGRRLGQVPAKGSYWFPARQDLDTMMSKIDSQLVDQIVMYNGPYSALYGPGLSFYDVRLLQAPRYDDGSPFQAHSSSVLQYETNGEQWLGRQAFWGGDGLWGFRGGYSHRGGSDYETGNGDRLPSSYKSRQADLALGAWVTPSSRIDFQYLRLDQTDVEFPGQFFDINALVTDSFSTTYEVLDQERFDLLTVDGWYNRTNFYGDNLRPGKRGLLPLDNEQTLPGALVTTRLTSFTDVAAHSAGFRLAIGWGDPSDELFRAGADLRYLGQRIDETSNLLVTSRPLDQGSNPTGPPEIIFDQTFFNPLPKAYSSNPGVFCEWQRPVSDQARVRTGARADWVSMNAADMYPGINENLSDALGGSFNQHFNLGSGFVTLEYQLTDEYAVNAGTGFGMRPPTMTEMYAFGPFIAVLPQYIFTSLFGDPNLRPEKMGQIDLGGSANYGYTRSGLNFYHAWVEDYITYDFLDTGGSAAYATVNTPLATLAGCEAYGECDLTSMITSFGTLSFVEGRDHSRTSTISRQRQIIAPTSASNQRSQRLEFDPMSGNFVPVGPTSTVDHEPLPVIAPLSSRVGFRLHPVADARWTVELVANVVDNQDRVATSLRELVTPGYTTYDVLAFQRLTDAFVVTAGVRNLTDKYYQTYYDTRQVGATPITTVFQPGITFFFGCEYVR